MSSSIQDKFLRELKEKLNQKAYGSISEEIVLLKSFKYYDLEDKGKANFDLFEKSIRKIGLYSLSKEEIKEVYNIYKEENEDYVDYKEFVALLYTPNKSKKNKPAQGNEIVKNDIDIKQYQTGTKKEFVEQEDVQNIMEKIRNKLKNRGVSSICKFAKNFRIVDKNGSQTIDFNEFQIACYEFQFDITEDEAKKAFLSFDRDNTGEIDYDEFLRGVRGNMNEFRKKLVKQAFDILDINKNGEISFEEIKEKYNARKHPDVMSGKRSEDEVLKEFMDTFQDTYNYLCGTENDNKITIEEFEEYYENVSMSIDDDKYFELMINNAWRMNENTTYNNDKKGWGNIKKEGSDNNSNCKEKNLRGAYKEKFGEKRPGQNEEEFRKEQNSNCLKKFKKELILKGKGSLTQLKNLFKTQQAQNTKNIELEDFAKTIKDCGLKLTDDEIENLYIQFDKENKGFLNYNDIINTIRPELNNIRTTIIKKAFDKLDEDKSGILDINDIKSRYNAKKNMTVKSGKKKEEDVYSEFIDLFNKHHILFSGIKSKRVDFKEFLDYYKDISFYYNNDDEFINDISIAWNLENKKVKEKPISFKASYNSPYGSDYVNTDIKDSNYNNNSIIDKFRDKLSKRGPRGIMSIRRQFLIADDNNSKTIDLDEFKKFCHDYRINLKENEIEELFNEFDTDKSCMINYDEFLRGIVGEMNEKRKSIVRHAFNKLDKDGSGLVDIDDIRQIYNAKNHPDIKKGKKTEDEILGEFLDTFEYQFSLLNDNKTKDNKISLDEFIEYYNNISMSIDNDEYFEEIIKNAWNLEGRNISKAAWRQDI